MEAKALIMGKERNESLKTETVRPTFRGAYLERFLRLAEEIDPLAPLRQREAVLEELAWARGRPTGTDQLKYRAFLLVLRDLLGQGWQVQYRQRSIFISRPDYTRGRHGKLDPATVKSLI